MNNKISEEIKLLVDNKLSERESKELIKKIKKDENLKIEFALYSKLKLKAREKLKEKLKSELIYSDNTAGATYLEQIRSAAFAGKTKITEEDLPIDEGTIDEFLEGDE